MIRPTARTHVRTNCKKSRAGFSLVELVVTAVMLTVAVNGVSSLVMSASRLEEANWELTDAHNSAREIAEVLQTMDPEMVWAMFNSDPNDDPDGAGTAPGTSFEIDSLSLEGLEYEFMLGSVSFPDGQPRTEDATNQSLIWPVTIELSWEGRTGTKRIRRRALLTTTQRNRGNKSFVCTSSSSNSYLPDSL